jgi:hypothetical protein
VVLRDQLLGNNRIVDALPDLARYEIGSRRIRRTVGQHIAEIAHPDAKTRRGVELLPEGLAFL